VFGALFVGPIGQGLVHQILQTQIDMTGNLLSGQQFLVLGSPFGIVSIPDKANLVEQFHVAVRQIVMLALIALKELLTVVSLKMSQSLVWWIFFWNYSSIPVE
jgi:hypothetical protein